MQKKNFSFFCIKWPFFFYSSLVGRHSSLVNHLFNPNAKKNVSFIFSHKMILFLLLVTRYSSLVTHSLKSRKKNFLFFPIKWYLFSHSSLVTHFSFYSLMVTCLSSLTLSVQKQKTIFIFYFLQIMILFLLLVTRHSSLVTYFISPKAERKFLF